MRFCDLMSVGRDLLNPNKQQKLRGEIFEAEFSSISQDRMRLWKVNQAISKSKKRSLLGVSPSWNFYDLYLLDCINNALKTKDNNEIFDVIDLDTMPGLPTIQSIFGYINPRQEPVLGIWEDGILVNSFWGWEAKNVLIDKYKFTWSPFEEDHIKSRRCENF